MFCHDVQIFVHWSTPASWQRLSPLNSFLNWGLILRLSYTSLRCLIWARILLSQLSKNPHPQYLIILSIWSSTSSPPSPRWSPIALACLQQESWWVNLAGIRLYPWCFFIAILQALTPTLPLGHKFPLFLFVFRVEPNLSFPLHLSWQSPWIKSAISCFSKCHK